MGAAPSGYAVELVHTDTPEEFSGAGPEQQGQGLQVQVCRVKEWCSLSMEAEHLQKIHSLVL